MIKRLLQQENAYFDTGALYQNKRFLGNRQPDPNVDSALKKR